MAGLGASPFYRGLTSRIHEIENYASAEVGRLEGVVRALQDENKRLKEQGQLAVQSLSKPSNGNLRCMQTDGELSALADSGALPQKLAQGEPKFTVSKRPPVERSMDNETMKQRVREANTKSVYNVTDLYHYDGFFQKAARSAWFENLTLLSVILNAIWIMIEIDYNKEKSLLEAHWGFILGEVVFCVIFTTELIFRFLAFRIKMDAFSEMWFLFDLFLVVIMLVETVVLSLVIYLTADGTGDGIGSLSALRLLRLLRLTRVIGISRVVPELMVMLRGLLAAFRSVLITGFIFGVVTYLFAIIMRLLAEGTEVGEELFPSVPSSFMSLLIEGMLPDNAGMMRTLEEEAWYLVIIFFCFLFFAGLTIMNMLIGVLCDVVSSVSSDERQQMEVERMTTKLQNILKTVDADYDGRVSKTEFEGMLDNDEALKILQHVGVDVHALVDDADYIFENSTELQFEDFKEVVLQFRPTQIAIIRSIAGMRRFVRNNLQDLDKRLLHMEATLPRLLDTYQQV